LEDVGRVSGMTEKQHSDWKKITQETPFRWGGEGGWEEEQKKNDQTVHAKKKRER